MLIGYEDEDQFNGQRNDKDNMATLIGKMTLTTTAMTTFRYFDDDDDDDNSGSTVQNNNHFA